MRLCDAHVDELETTLFADLERVHPTASTLYVGRTCFPERRLLQHRAAKNLSALRVLRWCDQPTETAHLEERMIALSAKWAKSANRNEHSDGRWSSSTANAVYVAWAPKSGHRVPAGRRVATLDLLERVPARVGLPDQLQQTLVTPLSATAAELELERFETTQAKPPRGGRGR